MEALQNITHPTKIQFNNNKLKEIQKLSTIFTDIAAIRAFESMSDKQLPRVEKILLDNRMKKQNNTSDGELPRVDIQVTKEVSCS